MKCAKELAGLGASAEACFAQKTASPYSNKRKTDALSASYCNVCKHRRHRSRDYRKKSRLQVSFSSRKSSHKGGQSKSGITYFNCGQTGHYANKCPSARHQKPYPSVDTQLRAPLTRKRSRDGPFESRHSKRNRLQTSSQDGSTQELSQEDFKSPVDALSL